MQDLMVVPALIVVSLLVEPEFAAWAEIALALAEAIIAVTAILLFGRFVLRPLLRQAALTGIRELIMAIVLFTVAAAALGTEAAGLSAELGAFLAGLLLAESEYRHQIEVDIEPFKGLLLGLFWPWSPNSSCGSSRRSPVCLC
jgi:CPA2 family monovalent cation:H+ antiporter-2